MGESIFPFIQDTGGTAANPSGELPIPREYAWDFQANCFNVVDGKLQVVTRQEAIKIWAMKALKTPRYRYLAYSWNYGHELEDLIGQGLSKEMALSEAKRYIREALLPNPYILEVRNFRINFNESTVQVDCTLATPYGEVEIRV